MKTHLPSDDSDADEDLFTLKAISESLSYCEPPGDPEGETVTGPEPENASAGSVRGCIGDLSSKFTKLNYPGLPHYQSELPITLPI